MGSRDDVRFIGNSFSFFLFIDLRCPECTTGCSKDSAKLVIHVLFSIFLFPFSFIFKPREKRQNGDKIRPTSEPTIHYEWVHGWDWRHYFWFKYCYDYRKDAQRDRYFPNDSANTKVFLSLSVLFVANIGDLQFNSSLDDSFILTSFSASCLLLLHFVHGSFFSSTFHSILAIDRSVKSNTWSKSRLSSRFLTFPIWHPRFDQRRHFLFGYWDLCRSKKKEFLFSSRYMWYMLNVPASSACTIVKLCISEFQGK